MEVLEEETLRSCRMGRSGSTTNCGYFYVCRNVVNLNTLLPKCFFFYQKLSHHWGGLTKKIQHRHSLNIHAGANCTDILEFLLNKFQACEHINKRWFSTVCYRLSSTQTPCIGACLNVGVYHFTASREKFSPSYFIHSHRCCTVHKVPPLLSNHAQHFCIAQFN